jgi:hypothetical protein
MVIHSHSAPMRAVKPANRRFPLFPSSLSRSADPNRRRLRARGPVPN